MNVGIIGTGKHGSRYAHHIINDISGLTLSAISRRSPQGQKQADNWQCRYYEDWRDLICDPAIDAVLSVVPPALNLDIAKTCAKEKKPLLLEKPLAVTLQAGNEIVALFDNAKIGLTIGHTLRYNPVIQAARANIHQIGQIYSIVAQHHLEPSSLAWLEDPKQAGAGVTLHTAIHVFDALAYITGLKIKRLRATTYQYHNPGVEDLLSAQLEFDSGAVGFVQSGKICPARFGGYQFYGEMGLLSGDQIYNELELIRGTKRSALTTTTETFAIKQLLSDWRDFLAGKGENPIAGEVGLEALKISMACLESAEKDTWVEECAL